MPKKTQNSGWNYKLEVLVWGSKTRAESSIATREWGLWADGHSQALAPKLLHGLRQGQNCCQKPDEQWLGSLLLRICHHLKLGVATECKSLQSISLSTASYLDQRKTCNNNVGPFSLHVLTPRQLNIVQGIQDTWLATQAEEIKTSLQRHYWNPGKSVGCRKKSKNWLTQISKKVLKRIN